MAGHTKHWVQILSKQTGNLRNFLALRVGQWHRLPRKTVVPTLLAIVLRGLDQLHLAFTTSVQGTGLDDS